MVFPTQLLAASLLPNKGIFFNATTATKLAATLDYSKKKIDNDDKLISTLAATNGKLLNLSDEYKLKITGLEKDKDIYKTRGDKFEGVYTTCTKELQDCNDSKPSRLVWYGAGVVSSLVLVLGIFFVAR